MAEMLPAKRYNCLLVNDTGLSGHLGSRVVVKRLVELFEAEGLNLVTGFTWAEFLDSKTPKNYDCLIVNGEGALHHASRAEYLFYKTCRIATLKNIPVILLNATLQNISNSTLDAVRRCSLVYVRDVASLRYLMANGLPSKHVPDPTLTFTNFNSTPQPRTSPPLVTDSSMVDFSIEIFNNLARKRRRSMVSLFGPSQKTCSRLLYLTKRAIFSCIRHPRRWLRYGLSISSPELFLEFLSRSEGLYTGRYHAVCFALVTKTPFHFAEANTGKITYLIQDVGLNQEPLTRKHFLSQINEASEGFPELDVGAVERFLEYARVSNKSMARDVAHFLDARMLRRP